MSKPEMYYRLRSRDGLTSEIKPLDKFMPTLRSALSTRLVLIGSSLNEKASESIFETRDYECVSSPKTVLLFEFEEK